MATPKPKRPRQPRPPAAPNGLLPRLGVHGSPGDLLAAFKALLAQTQLQLAIQSVEATFYERLFSPVVTLWYMVFQRLHQDHTLQAVVTNASQGGADALVPHRTPLSQRLRSLATTAFSKARQRLPASLIHAALAAQGQQVAAHLRDWLWRGWRVVLVDGSQVRLRPFPAVSDQFTASANQRGRAYWVLMRVVAVFCAHTGLVLASASASTKVSEQALLGPLIRNGPARCLYIGDANFGVFSIVRAVLDARSQCLVRLTQSRARKLLGPQRRRRQAALDQPITWTPSRADHRSVGTESQPLSGRLLVVCCRRPGFRPQWLHLFTTLLDAQAYPATDLLELYGLRWQVELDLRYVKTQMEMDRLECKSAAMAEKEWLAALMAYNLVRTVMVAAAAHRAVPLGRLAFSATRRLLLEWLADWRGADLASWQRLLDQVAALRHPSRTKPRPSEPRRKRHVRESFPPLRGSRAAARRQLRAMQRKS